MLITELSLVSRGRAACTTENTDVRLVSRTRCHSSAGNSAKGTWLIVPALFTSTSTEPKWSRHCWMSAATSAGRVPSALGRRRDPPRRGPVGARQAVLARGLVEPGGQCSDMVAAVAVAGQHVGAGSGHGHGDGPPDAPDPAGEQHRAAFG